MKRRLFTSLLLIVMCFAIIGTALAASCDGSIWTGKPTIFGTGYYCVAAKNKSDPVTNLNWAQAYCYNSGGATIAQASTTRNVTAVANAGQVKPSSGYGAWGITGYACGGNSRFTSGAWD